jgi:hypothetical protein
VAGGRRARALCHALVAPSGCVAVCADSRLCMRALVGVPRSPLSLSLSLSRARRICTAPPWTAWTP